MHRWIFALVLAVAGLTGLLMTLCGVRVAVGGGGQPLAIVLGVVLGIAPGLAIVSACVKTWRVRHGAASAARADGRPPPG